MGREKADVGIITFHCSNNYGALLQAYGLKHFLDGSGIRADVVRYEPPYMTGRHWWIPYKFWQGAGRRLERMIYAWSAFGVHLRWRKSFARQRANMKRFRTEYLLRRGQRKILSEKGLKKLSYRRYVVGSDQIWNPAITFGLRNAYFGAFEGRRKEKVVAYGASFGGVSLPAEYEARFSELLQHVDAVSVRERAAVPFVERFFPGEVTAVLDPVFFLGREQWEQVERLPDRSGYILVYVTESNPQLTEYAKKLSRDTGLPVLEVRTDPVGAEKNFPVDSSAGPAEFLGYIHRADYVVTNSFHAAAFSIIYQKRFVVFAHSSRGARLKNILELHGLEDRLCREGQNAGIDGFVDWEAVKSRTEQAVRESAEFLRKNLLDS